MSDNEQKNENREKVADIVAEMRYGTIPKHRTDHELLAIYADRIEAAWKRERAKVEADALAVGGIVEAARRSTAEKSSAVGNAAAMREALELAIKVDDWCCSQTDDPLECCEYSCIYQVEPHGEAGADCPWKKIRAALFRAREDLRQVQGRSERVCGVYRTVET